MAFYNSDINALFIHIPKAYGSSIKHTLELMNFYRIIDNGDMSKYQGTLQYAIDTTDMINNNTFIFTFIRNPINRYISGCNFCSLDMNTALDNNYLTLYDYWHTVLPQSKHLENSNNYKINFIGKCENIKEDWQELMNILVSLGLNEDICVNEILNVNKTNKVLPMNNKDDITPSLRNKINNHFASDIILYYVINNKNVNICYILGSDSFNKTPPLILLITIIIILILVIINSLKF